MNLLFIIHRFHDNQLSAHLLPLASLPQVCHILVVSHRKGPPLPKVVYYTPPSFFQRSILRRLFNMAIVYALGASRKIDKAVMWEDPLGAVLCLLPIKIIQRRTHIGLWMLTERRFLISGGLFPPLSPKQKLQRWQEWVRSGIFSLLPLFDFFISVGKKALTALDSSPRLFSKPRYEINFHIDSVRFAPAGGKKEVTVQPSHLSFPRKWESSALAREKTPWISASAGMTQEEKGMMKEGADHLQKKYDLISVGWFEPRKNLWSLLRVAQELLQAYPSLHLLLVGSGSQEKGIKAWIDSQGLKSYIHTVSYTSNVEHFLKQSNIFMLTSLWEGISIAVCEAMACGLPVITFDVGSMAEVIQDGQNGFLIPPFDEALLKEKIMFLLTHPEQRVIMGEAARQTIQSRFSRLYLHSQWRKFLNL